MRHSSTQRHTHDAQIKRPCRNEALRRGEEERFGKKCVYLLAPGGGPAGCHGEGETGTGGDEGQTVINSTLTGWEGRSPDRPASREAEAPGGGPGDEVRI